MRLIDHLRDLGMSNRDAKAALASGKVYFRDTPTADAVREVDPKSVRVIANAPRAKPWHDPVIIHHDVHLAVVAKPPGMLAVPAASKRGVPSVQGYVRRTLGKALAVHRLDEGTSGLILFARTVKSQELLKDLFFTHDIEREYLAIVAGEFPEAAVTRDTILVRDRGDGLRGSVEDSGGKRAVSHFRRIREFGVKRTLVGARLETGRTHQIRIHLSEMGLPILGDRLYAIRSLGRAAPRLALHSTILAFRHPVTGEDMHFESPLADDLERLGRRR